VSAREAAPVVRAPDRAPPPAPARRTHRADRRALAAVCLAVFAVYATYAWIRHVQYETTNYDLGIFDQAIRDYAHFRAPIVPGAADLPDALTPAAP
jgi:hypothetical protein